MRNQVEHSTKEDVIVNMNVHHDDSSTLTVVKNCIDNDNTKENGEEIMKVSTIATLSSTKTTHMPNPDIVNTEQNGHDDSVPSTVVKDCRNRTNDGKQHDDNYHHGHDNECSPTKTKTTN
eukprot:2030650-Ditylum_brightwellii.AAC.1